MGKERVEVWWRDGEVVCVVVVSYAVNLNVKISPHNEGRLTWYYNICCSTEKKKIQKYKKLNLDSLTIMSTKAFTAFNMIY